MSAYEGRHLHLVSFAVPYPPDYGGAISVYRHLRALQALGLRVTLHCYTYGDRQAAPELAALCHAVHYYERPLGWRWQLSWRPYIVQTRRSAALRERLLADGHPIIWEGLHCGAWLRDAAFRGRRMALRLHNIEGEYYRRLAGAEAAPWRRWYYRWESWRLQAYERWVLPRTSATLLAISTRDADWLRGIGCKGVEVLPVFHAYEDLQIEKGKGNYAMFHGDLSVQDNAAAVRWLLSEVFAKIDYPFIVAGKNPPPALVARMNALPNVRWIANPSDLELERLIAGAQFQVLHSSNPSGMKVKLLHALFRGRFILANAAVYAPAEAAHWVLPCETAEAYLQAIAAYKERPADELKASRQGVVQRFSNAAGAARMAALLFAGA